MTLLFLLSVGLLLRWPCIGWILRRPSQETFASRRFIVILLFRREKMEFWMGLLSRWVPRHWPIGMDLLGGKSVGSWTPTPTPSWLKFRTLISWEYSLPGPSQRKIQFH